MTHPITKKSLTLSIALIFSTAALLGCSDNRSDIKEHDKSMTDASKEKVSTVIYKTLEFTTPGQTDNDHLYLEEVLGEQALAEVE
ncbi:MAG: prolyl oligopeptidase, partial [Glaciecola sp.]